MDKNTKPPAKGNTNPTTPAPATSQPVPKTTPPEDSKTNTDTNKPTPKPDTNTNFKPAPDPTNKGTTPDPADKALDPKLPAKDGTVPPANPANPPVKAPQRSTPPATGAAAVLLARPFIIKTVKQDGTETVGSVTGSILSQSLDKIMLTTGQTDATMLTMAALRKLVPQMSRYAAIDKFCTPSGTLLDDEAISIIEYLNLEGSAASAAAAPATTASEPTSTDSVPASTAPIPATTTPVPANTTPAPPSTGGIASLTISFRPARLTTPATPLAAAPVLGQPSAVKPNEVPTATTLAPSAAKANLIADDMFGASGGDDATVKALGQQSGAGALSETQWSLVLRNCAVFYGWIIDPRTKRITRAPKPAFKLRSKVNEEPVAKIPDFVKPAAEVGAKSTPAAAPVSFAGSTVAAITPKSDLGIPNFRVNDDSRIDITAHESELTLAMARSDFSEESTEASVSAGGYGVTVGVSVGVASSESNTSKTTTTNSTRTLVGKYMFPRCDLLLWPDEMEPTPELATLLDTIRRTKSITALRRLHAEYGHLFCQRLTLGGRLLSTKIVTTSEKKTLEEHKESFKTSVGASVSGGFGGFSASASVKHDEASGSTNVNETSQRSQDEAAVFEAVGGDTILSTNPKLWSASVASHTMWRVINREAMSTMADVISGMPGYSAVQSWFVQAVPALSNYMVLNEAHECKARLRITSPTNSLSIPNAGNYAAFYLGHDPNAGVTPRLNGIDATSLQTFWFRIDMREDVPIFNPPTYRAPAIFGYDKFDIDGTKYGAEYNAGFVKTEWDIVAPFDDQLVHGTRVIVRSCPFKDPKQQTQPGEEVKTPNASHMVVFRNAQGEFLPAMSDSDEYQYWRIIKTDPSQKLIKPGDEIRLCWDFRDQTTGWRDFSQDIFGRRQPCAPFDAAGPLFLKVPWPRFEITGTPTSLIMSPDAGDLTTKAVSIDRKGTPGAQKYCLQDLRFRLDAVGNEGRGDSGEYLLNKLTQGGAVQHIDVRPMGYPMQMRYSMFWFGL